MPVNTFDFVLLVAGIHPNDTKNKKQCTASSLRKRDQATHRIKKQISLTRGPNVRHVDVRIVG
jgi:hypothetical protein